MALKRIEIYTQKEAFAVLLYDGLEIEIFKWKGKFIGGTRFSIFCGQNLDHAKNFMLTRNKYRQTFSFYQPMRQW